MYRLLIADSDPMNQEAVCGMLDWASYGFDSMLQAGSYAEVVDLALDQHPQLVLVNAEIEGGKGYDLIRQLRGAGSSAIFCLLSRRNTRDELHKAMRCGARECLHLPLQEDVLREFVEWVLTQELGGVLPQETLSPSHQDPVLLREYAAWRRRVLEDKERGLLAASVRDDDAIREVRADIAWYTKKLEELTC